jgi:hypothetical protein
MSWAVACAIPALSVLLVASIARLSAGAALGARVAAIALPIGVLAGVGWFRTSLGVPELGQGHGQWVLAIAPFALVFGAIVDLYITGKGVLRSSLVVVFALFIWVATGLSTRFDPAHILQFIMGGATAALASWQYGQRQADTPCHYIALAIGFSIGLAGIAFACGKNDVAVVALVLTGALLGYGLWRIPFGEDPGWLVRTTIIGCQIVIVLALPLNAYVAVCIAALSLFAGGTAYSTVRLPGRWQWGQGIIVLGLAALPAAIAFFYAYVINVAAG